MAEDYYYSDEQGFDADQPKHDFSIQQTLSELLDNETLAPEERARLMSNVDLWLLGRLEGQEPTTSLNERILMIENQLVVREKERMNRFGEEIIVSPRQERMITWLKDEMQDRTGGGVIIYGPPGNGKSTLLHVLALELNAGRGIREVNGTPFTTAAEAVASKALNPDVSNLFSYRAIERLMKLSERLAAGAENVGRQLLEFLKHAIEEDFPGITSYPEHTFRKALATRLKEYGLELPEGDVLYNDAFLQSVIEANGGAQRVVDIMLTYWQDQLETEKFNGIDKLKIGPIYKAAQFGQIVIIDELQRMSVPGYLGFGEGIEEILNPRKNGPETETVETSEGIPVSRRKGFLMLGSANEVSSISDHILRRFLVLPLETNLADLTWQARVLLSDDEGNSILKDRPNDEQDLVRFLLWWEALGRQNSISFNVNVLADMCRKLKEGKSFAKVISDILRQPEVGRLFLEFKAKGRRQFSYEQSVLSMGGSAAPGEAELPSLAELNFLANRQFFGEELTVAQPIDPSPTTDQDQAFSADLSLSPSKQGEARLSFASQSGQVEGWGPAGAEVASLPVPQLDTIVETTASPLGQSALVFGTRDGRTMMVAFDQPSGQTFPIYENSGEIFAPDPNHIQAIHWATETSGYMVLDRGNNTHEIISFAKELMAPDDEEPSNSYNVCLRLKSSASIAKTDPDARYTFQTGAQTLLIHRDQHTTIVHFSPTNPNQPFLIEAERQGVLKTSDGLFGTIVEQPAAQGAAAWVRYQ